MPTPLVHFFRSRGTAATPGYFIARTPWAGHKAVSAGPIRDQLSGALGGGRAHPNPYSSASTFDVGDEWIPTGTFKFSCIHYKGTNIGILTLRLDGTNDNGTIDGYAAAGSENNYSEITGIVRATAALCAIRYASPTKNASSTDYALPVNTYALVRTGA